MARRKKVVEGVVSTFLLPQTLVDKLQSAAELRQVGVADAVREILTGRIEDYLLDSMRIAVKMAEDNQEIRPLFEVNKDKSKIEMNGMSDKEFAILGNAILAYQELKKRNYVLHERNIGDAEKHN